jgi:hypothetical protein
MIAWLAVIVAGVVFAADLLFPLGVAVPMAYVGPVLLGLRTSGRSIPLTMAIVGSVLTVIGFFVPAPTGPIWMGIANRALAIGILWVTAFMVMLCNRSNEEVDRLRDMLALCASCKKVRDDAGFWKGMERYVEEQFDVLFSHSLCPDCRQKWEAEMEHDPRTVESVPARDGG